MTKKRWLPIAACTFLLAGCDPLRVSKPKPTKAEAARSVAPNFTLKDAQGRNVQLSDYKGKVVVLNFWATWCTPCRFEIPWLIDFEQRFKDRGFAVLGVSMDDDGWESVKPYIEKRKVNYRMVIGTPEVADLFGGVESLPTTFILDRKGRIANTHIGLVSKSDMEVEIEALLTGKPRPAGDSDAKPSGAE